MPVMDLHEVLHIVIVHVPLPHHLLVCRLSLPFRRLFRAHRAQTHNPLAIVPVLVLALLKRHLLAAKRGFKCFVQILGLLSWCHDLNLLLGVFCRRLI